MRSIQVCKTCQSFESIYVGADREFDYFCKADIRSKKATQGAFEALELPHSCSHALEHTIACQSRCIAICKTCEHMIDMSDVVSVFGELPDGTNAIPEEEMDDASLACDFEWDKFAQGKRLGKFEYRFLPKDCPKMDAQMTEE